MHNDIWFRPKYSMTLASANSANSSSAYGQVTRASVEPSSPPTNRSWLDRRVHEVTRRGRKAMA